MGWAHREAAQSEGALLVLCRGVPDDMARIHNEVRESSRVKQIMHGFHPSEALVLDV